MTLLTSVVYASCPPIFVHFLHFRGGVCVHQVFRDVLGLWEASDNKFRPVRGQFVYVHGNQIDLTSNSRFGGTRRGNRE